MNDKFFEFLKKYKTRIFPHFHIPLQSADDKVLADMGREYDTSFYSEKINLLRKIYPEVIISCDLIVGYPLETYESFLKTLEFIKKTKFNWVHVFLTHQENLLKVIKNMEILYVMMLKKGKNNNPVELIIW